MKHSLSHSDLKIPQEESPPPLPKAKRAVTYSSCKNKYGKFIIINNNPDEVDERPFWYISPVLSRASSSMESEGETVVSIEEESNDESINASSPGFIAASLDAVVPIPRTRYEIWLEDFLHNNNDRAEVIGWSSGFNSW